MLQESGFYLYALYNKNKPKSDELMAECGAEYFRVSTVSHLFGHTVIAFIDWLTDLLLYLIMFHLFANSFINRCVIQFVHNVRIF